LTFGRSGAQALNSSKFEQQQFGTAGVQGVNTYLPKKLRCDMTLTTPTWGQFVITGLLRAGGKPPHPAIGKQGPHICILGGLQLSSAGTDCIGWTWE